MKQYLDKDIKILQDNLELIRNTGGWTAEEFGEMIGVTKQTIRNLETNATTLTKTQYIAIRAVLDYEVSLKNDDKITTVLNIIFHSNPLSEEDRKKALAFAVGAAKAKLDNTAFVAGMVALLGTMTLAAISAGAWIAKIMAKK